MMAVRVLSRDQSGNSLIQVLIALGLSSILLLVIMQMAKMQQDIIATVNANANSSNQMGLIKIALSNNTTCALNLSNLTIPNPLTSGFSYSLTQLNYPNGGGPVTTIYSVPPTSPSIKTWISSIEVKNFVKLDPTNYKAEVFVTSNSQGTILGGKTHKSSAIPIALQIQGGGSGLVVACSLPLYRKLLFA